MATLNIHEYAVSSKNDAWPMEPPLVEQTALSIGSETDSSAFGASTYWVRLSCDGACRVAFGTAPTAGANGIYLPAGYNAFHAVQPGHKVSVISAS